MNIESIDEAIDRYVTERMSQGKEKAGERFLAYAYLKNRGEDALEFLRKTGGLCRYYMNYLKAMENPFRGPEIALIASMLAIAIYFVILMTTEGVTVLGIILLSGTLVHGGSLIVRVCRKWCDVGVMIAIYREITQLIDRELEGHA